MSLFRHAANISDVFTTLEIVREPRGEAAATRLDAYKQILTFHIDKLVIRISENPAQ